MSVLKILREFWKWTGTVPVCPTCHGTGEPDLVRGYTAYVWWRGQRVRVCHHCHGAGKV